MKKIILTVTLTVTFYAASFAGFNSADKKLLSELSAALQSSRQAHWSSTSEYQRAAFDFNGKEVFAFYDVADNTLIGFSSHIKENDLPPEGLVNLKKKFSGWAVEDATMFIDAKGNINYFAQVTKNKNSIALRVNANGKVSIYNKM